MSDVMHTRLVGAALVALGAALPIGEGAVWATVAVLAVLLVQRPRQLPRHALSTGDAGRVMAALGMYLIFGVWAMLASGHGALRPAEWGRLGPWVLLPVVVLSMASVPKRWHARAAFGFVASLSVASVFGLVCYGLDTRPGELLMRPSDLAAHQGFVPGTLRTVAGGFYFHRLKMAHVLLVGIGAVWSQCICVRDDEPVVRRIGAWLALGLMLACLVLTYTRGAFLGVAAGAMMSLALSTRRMQLRAVVALGLVVCMLSVVPQVRARLTSMRQTHAAQVRGLIWSQAIDVIADHPMGVGLGNYTPIIGRYYDRVDPGFATRTYPHNILLAAWAEAGPAGLVAYASIWLTLARRGLRLARRHKGRCAGDADSCVAACRAAAAAVFVAVALWTVGMTHDVLYHNVVAQTFIAALAWCLGQRYHDASAAPRAQAAFPSAPSI